MNGEGGLVFDLYCEGPAVVDVRLHSNRPLFVPRLLCGKPPSEALRLLGTMFRICGVAHRFAGLMAWRQATRAEVLPRVHQAQQLLVNLETVREHVWHTLVTWPELLGSEPQRNAGLTLLSRLLPEMERALFESGQGLVIDARLATDAAAVEKTVAQLEVLIERHVLGMSMQQWRAIDSAQQLNEWAGHCDTPAARLIGTMVERSWQRLGQPSGDVHDHAYTLPDLTGTDVERALVGEARDGFIARPTWQGHCQETNAWTRQAGQPLVSAVTAAYGKGGLARWVARLVELVELFQSIKQNGRDLAVCGEDVAPAQADSATGRGMAMVEAARGRLMHWLALERGVVADYAIVAPTEWNFHPQGVAVQGLKTLAADDPPQLKQQAALWINAIDPCVGYELRIH